MSVLSVPCSGRGVPWNFVFDVPTRQQDLVIQEFTVAAEFVTFTWAGMAPRTADP